MFEILRSGGGGSLQEPVSVFFCGYREFTGKVQRPEPPKSGPFREFSTGIGHFPPTGLISKQGI